MIKVVVRQLLSQKLNTSVHIAGLSLGMTVCLLIGLFVRFELSFDNYHPQAAKTYRINQVWSNNGTQNYNFDTPFPLFDALRQTTTGLEHITFAHQVRDITIDVGNDMRFIEPKVLLTDATFPDVFKIEVIEGKGKETLSKPYQALLTESLAKKYFGNENAVGKTFRFRSKYDITVGGVIKDLPANTHLPATLILSYAPDADYMRAERNGWQYTSGTGTYVVIPDGYDKEVLITQLKRLADEHVNSNPDIPKGVRTDYTIQPMSSIHFDSVTRGSQWVAAVNPTWIWFFGSIGIAVLALACINFINLSTAQALTRAKEVGVRKSIGAGRSNLIFQFLRESWILAGVSGIIAICAAQVFLPSMNILLEKQITFGITDSPFLLMVLITSIFIVGLLAGLYPAWVITRFNPAMALRSSFSSQGERGSSWLRSSLVVVQFAISAGLLMSLILISRQVNFMRNMDVGFNKNNVIITKLGGRGISSAYNHLLEQIPQVEDWSYSMTPPSSKVNWGTSISLRDEKDIERHNVNVFLGDEKFCAMYDFRLLAGRFPLASDTSYTSSRLPQDQWVLKAVVNKQVLNVLKLGTPEQAIGKYFHFGITGKTEIIGVVDDFNSTSLHMAIGPALIAQFGTQYAMAGIRIRPDSDIPATIAALEKAWKASYPNGVFSYTFLDQQIDAYYKAEQRIYELFKVFSSLAMLISCLGLFGLVTFAAQRRMKEIGIRKVLGATSASIVQLLSKDFVAMVLIALIIATPLVYYGISQWLQAFAYRIDIGWTAFVMAGSVSIALALLTVGVQSLRATLVNPANVLKSE